MVFQLYHQLESIYSGSDFVLYNTRNETLSVGKRGGKVPTDIEELDELMKKYFPETSCNVQELSEDDAFKRPFVKTVSIDFDLRGRYSQYFIIIYEQPAQILLSFRRGKLTLEDAQRDSYLSFVKCIFGDDVVQEQIFLKK